jgi:hypothetical protein
MATKLYSKLTRKLIAQRAELIECYKDEYNEREGYQEVLSSAFDTKLYENVEAWEEETGLIYAEAERALDTLNDSLHRTQIAINDLGNAINHLTGETTVETFWG